MKQLSYFFFYTYIGLVLLAGFWGAFGLPALEYRLLYDLDLRNLPEYTRVNLLSQFRFLRALEMGFGVFALLFTQEIFHQRKFNALFLFIMASGVLARVMSLLQDGMASPPMLFFMFYEALGLGFIYAYTRKTHSVHAPA